MKVAVLGLGYIGLPTSALIASHRINTTGIDTNPHIVDTINRGEIHITEPDLAGLVHHVVKNSYLKAKINPEPADIFIITVPTPILPDKTPDISHVEKAVQSIIPHLSPSNLLIIESTCPVNTTLQIRDLIYDSRKDLKDKLYIAYCPERVLPGRILYELEYNDRVIGGINKGSSERASLFYSRFTKGDLHITDSRTAEMCKLIENSYRDLNIAFANELSILCDHLDIDVFDLISLTNKHPRVNILKPSPGVGGHCIAVDPYFLSSQFPEYTKLISLSRELNNYKTQWVIEKIKNTALAYTRKRDKKPTIALMGLSFKPDIDDLRESPALYIAETLRNDKEYNIICSEPNIGQYDGFSLYSCEEAIQNSDIIAFLVAHNQYKNISLPRQKTILDFCNAIKEQNYGY